MFKVGVRPESPVYLCHQGSRSVSPVPTACRLQTEMLRPCTNLPWCRVSSFSGLVKTAGLECPGGERRAPRTVKSSHRQCANEQAPQCTHKTRFAKPGKMLGGGQFSAHCSKASSSPSCCAGATTGCMCRKRKRSAGTAVSSWAALRWPRAGKTAGPGPASDALKPALLGQGESFLKASWPGLVGWSWSEGHRLGPL